MKPTPPGWPRIAPSLYYPNPRAAIDWLCQAFGFEVRLLVEGDGGSVAHSELTFGDGLIMVSGSKTDKFAFRKTPDDVQGANTQNLMVYVDDIEAHCKRARAAGAVVTDEISTHDYGEDYWVDRSYGCKDVGGHHWWFSERIRGPKSA
ncbi:MAG: VOC family protein [Myxococcota bacterium]